MEEDKRRGGGKRKNEVCLLMFVSMKQCVICHFEENDEKMEMSTHLPSTYVRCVREGGGDEEVMRGVEETKK